MIQLFFLIISGAAIMTMISFAAWLIGRYFAYRHWKRKERRATKVKRMHVIGSDIVEVEEEL